MPYRIAGIAVHKKMLAVVVSDVEIESEYQCERRMFGSSPDQLRSLAAWLLEQEVEEAVMESTAQYWKPVWEALERYWKPIRERREGAGRMSGTLHLAQALSNRGRRGRKNDFRDAERLVKRLVSQELTLSFVPDAEQRLWRTVTRTKYRGPYQVIQFGFGFIGGQCTPYAEGASRRRNRSRGSSRRGRSARARRPGTVTRCTGCVHGAQPGLPPAGEDGARGVAIDRAADRATGPGDRESAPPASGCSRTAGRSPRSRGGFSATDHCRSGCQGSDLRFRQESLLLGGGMPGRGRERGRELQPTLAEGQPPHAPHSQSG